MSVLRVCSLCLLGLALLLAGCSGSEETESAPAPVLSVFDRGSSDPADEEMEEGEARGGDEDPAVRSIAFDPAEPASRARFRAIPRVAGDWTSLQYEWKLNGAPFGTNTAQVVLPRIATGDEIGLRVVPFRGKRRGEALEVRSVVRNQRPELQKLAIERVGEGDSLAGGSELWRAVVVADDPDDDDLEIEYLWYVNGQETDVEEEFYPAGEMTRGERLAVRVRAFDGEAWSPFTRSGEIVIGNSPPTIVSVPPRPDESGYFRYQLRAEDADGDDEFHFALRTAPRGMQIDEINGIVTWQPGSTQVGRHEVEVVVTDRDGGESTQSFDLSLVALTESDSEGAGPAAMR